MNTRWRWLGQLINLPGTLDDIKKWRKVLGVLSLSVVQWWEKARAWLAGAIVPRAEMVAIVDMGLWWIGAIAGVLAALMFLAMCWNTYKKYATAPCAHGGSDSGLSRETPGPQLGTAPTSYTWSESKEVSGEVAEIIDSLERIPPTRLAWERAVQPHIGKWLKVQGIIGDISLSLIWVVVRLGWDPAIALHFSDSEWGERLETMDAGDAISAEGRITSITRLGVIEIRMDNCALVDE